MEANTPDFDTQPDWRPLELAVSREQLCDFMHMGKVGNIQLYKHRNTRRYLNIDACSGLCFEYTSGQYQSIERDWAIAYALGSYRDTSRPLR